MKLRSLALITGIATSGIVASGAFAPAQAIGIFLTSQAGYTGPVLDLSSQANGEYNFTFGPVALPNGITFTSNATGTTDPGGSILGQGYYELGSSLEDPNGNGWFNNPAVYAGLDGDGGYMTFSFASAVQSFGAFVNYAPEFGDDPVISTYNGNTLLSSFNLKTAPGGSISSPGRKNYFEFRGISEATASITSFRLSGGYMIATATADGSVFVPVPVPATDVPEPFTIVGTLVGGSAALRMRRKLKSSTKSKR
jgi:hypothetical protein